MTENIWAPHLVYHKEKVLFKNKQNCTTICVCVYIYLFIHSFIHWCIFSSAKREDGEGGIMFDNEDEKEQWEEDQKVSITDMCHQ